MNVGAELNHAAITTIGLDIAKSVFQVHGVGASGNANSPACLASVLGKAISTVAIVKVA
jgi:hypothetical protein